MPCLASAVGALPTPLRVAQQPLASPALQSIPVVTHTTPRTIRIDALHRREARNMVLQVLLVRQDTLVEHVAERQARRSTPESAVNGGDEVIEEPEETPLCA